MQTSRRPSLGPIVRWFLALELAVFAWTLAQAWREAGALSLLMLRNVCAYTLVSMLVGGVLAFALAWTVRRAGRHARWASMGAAGALVALILGPEAILAVAHGSLPTQLPQRELRLVYLGCLAAAFLGGAIGQWRWHGRGHSPQRVDALLVAGALSIGAVFGATSLVVAARSDTSTSLAGGERPPDIVLVVIDALRATALGGSPLDVSPHLDALARRGVRFDGCFSVATTSVPGHAGILFGADVREHLALTNSHDAPASLPSLAASLRERGYRTWGVCRNQLISRQAGFGAGFDFYWSSGRRALDRAPLVFAALSVAPLQIGGQFLDVDWVGFYARALLMAAGSDRPTFLFLQFLHCHQPYRDGNGWATPDNVARVREAYRDGTFVNRSEYGDDEVARFHASYLGAVQYVDSIVGRLVERLDARDTPSVIVVTADHGENLAEHEGAEVGEHGGYYDTSIRIPLIVAGERVPGGVVSDVLTGHDRIEDLALRLAGDASPVSPVEFESIFRKEQHFIYSDPYAIALGDSLKVVMDEAEIALLEADAPFDSSATPLVFSWRSDPLDALPLARRDARVSDLWRTVTSSWRALEERGALDPPTSLDPKRLEALRALGYVD